jgi:hypothetical protein
VNYTKTQTVNGDGGEPPKMVILKHTPTAGLRIRKMPKKMEKKTETVQVIPEVIPIKQYSLFEFKLFILIDEQLFLMD